VRNEGKARLCPRPPGGREGRIGLVRRLYSFPADTNRLSGVVDRDIEGARERGAGKESYNFGGGLSLRAAISGETKGNCKKGKGRGEGDCSPSGGDSDAPEERGTS